MGGWGGASWGASTITAVQKLWKVVALSTKRSEITCSLEYFIRSFTSSSTSPQTFVIVVPPVKSVFSLLILPNLDWFTHCTPQHPLGISYLSSLSANWLVITLTITLIYLEISSLSGNKLVVNLTLTLTLTKKPRETENYDLFLFSLLYFLITTITILWVTYWYN